LTANTSLRAPILRPQIRCIHATTPLLKKTRFYDDRRNQKGKQQEVEEKDQEESSEASSGSLLQADCCTVVLVQEFIYLGQDPLDIQILTQQLNDSVAHFQKSAYAIKGGQSDPAMIRALQVELPDNLGGKMNFSDLANVGPKPGEARSLLITVFDTEVHTPERPNDSNRSIQNTL